MPPSTAVSAHAKGAQSNGVNITRLVKRVTMGVTASEMALAEQLGWQGYLSYQLNHNRIDDRACQDVVMTRYRFAFLPIESLVSANPPDVQAHLREATLYRAAFSKRQLFERMVELWSDHFNQDIDKVQQLLAVDLNNVIRANALGKFPDMVRASTKSPSMLAYLDQNISQSSAPNQNYARELLELHTVGVDGGYTQDDVAELSRVLTGWTIAGGKFAFNPSIHDWGAKTVMGMTIPAGSPSLGQAGVREGEQIVDMLVAHPNTARFIATKMLKWLLDPKPSEDKIRTVASAYTATGGDIKAMVRVILNETWMTAAPMKLKRPFHFVASALRSSTSNATLTTLNLQLAVLGQEAFSWDTPDGYPDAIEYWAGNIAPKWNFASLFSGLNSTSTVVIDTAPYLAGSPAAAVDLLDTNFFGGDMPLATRNRLLAYVGASPLTDASVRELIALVLCSNAFQWY